MNKISTEEVIQYLRTNGGWELLSEYKGVHDNIIITKNGYKAKMSFASFKANNNPILFGSKNEFFKENIKLYLHNKYPLVEFIDAKLVKKSGKSRIVVDMVDEAGHNFSKTWEHIYTTNCDLNCKICSRKLQTDKHRASMYKKWIGLIDTSKFEILEIPEILTSESRVSIKDIETGYKYNSSIRAFEKFNCEPFNVYSNKEFFLYNLSVYKEANGLESTPIAIKDTSKSHNIVTFKCKCGCNFDRSIYKWMDGRDLCVKCSNRQSSYERKVEEFLIKNNISYITEFRYNSCKDEKPLPFDFYLNDYNILIEIDGQQHYQPVAFGGDNSEIEKRFNLQIKHDKIKEDFCKSNNIPLLRIPYTYFLTNEWENLIINFIKPLGK